MSEALICETVTFKTEVIELSSSNINVIFSLPYFFSSFFFSTVNVKLVSLPFDGTPLTKALTGAEFQFPEAFNTTSFELIGFIESFNLTSLVDSVKYFPPFSSKPLIPNIAVDGIICSRYGNT